MSRSSKDLTAAFVARVRVPGKYYDRFGLFLRVSPTGRKYFEQRVTFRRRRRTKGIGRYPLVTLVAARDAAVDNLRKVKAGIDIFAPVREVPTMTAAMVRMLARREPRYRGRKTRKQRELAYRRHAEPVIGDLLVSEIKARHFYQVFESLVADHYSVARLLRTQFRMVMQWAVVNEYRIDDPAGDPLAQLFRDERPKKRHYPAIHHCGVGQFITRVERGHDSLSTQLWFEWLVLTGVRNNEARCAQWDEIDMAAACWTVPGERTKTRVEHPVPISTAGFAVLDRARKHLPRTDYLFPSTNLGLHHDARLNFLLRSLDMRAVPHGFRATFRTWAGESGVTAEVADSCLSHRVAGSSKRPYLRTPFLDERRDVMERWGRYVTESVAEARAQPSTGPLKMLPDEA